MTSPTALLTLLLLVIFAYSKDIQVDPSTPGRRVITTNSLIITITGGGNVPMFTYQQVNSTTQYKVMFQQAYQVQNISNFSEVPDSTISLPSYQSWSFSDVVTLNANQTNESVQMNITSTGANIPTFQFRIYINVTSYALKFDTVIGQMSTVWQSSANGFAVCYKLQDQGSYGNDSDVNLVNLVQDRKVGFGPNGYMSITPTAIDDTNKIINAFLKTSSDGLACVVYERFNNTLVHDPELGVTGSTSSNNAASVSITTLLIFCISIITTALLL
jgi:hypothetical protein